MSVPPMEENEAQAFLHGVLATVAKEARNVFVSRLSELVYERHGSRDASVLAVAVEDAEGIDLEWLQEHLADKASAEIAQLQGLVEGLVTDLAAERADVDTLSGKAYEAQREVTRLRRVLERIILDEFDVVTSDTYKVHSHAGIARRALNGEWI